MNLNKSILALAISSTLVACGGGGDSDSGTDNGTGGPTTTPAKVTLVGKTTKGTLANAQLKAYKYVDGTPVLLTDADLSADSILKTDDKGKYKITVLNYEGPVKVEAIVSTDVNSPTTMLCDAPLGCGATPYGAKLNLTSTNPNFSLSAITSVEENAEVTVNLSVLTHMATALVEKQGQISKQTIAEQSNIIAKAFDIKGDITTLEPTAVESAEETSKEDNVDELRYGLINAGIASAIFKGEADATDILSTKMKTIVDDLVANGGAILVEQDDAEPGFELALTDVFSAAQETAQKVSVDIQGDDSLDKSLVDNGTLGNEVVNLEKDKIDAKKEADSDGFVQPKQDSEPVTLTPVEYAKAMVEDVRVFANLLGLPTDTDSLGNETFSVEHTELVNNIEGFGNLVDDAALLLETKADGSDPLTLLTAVVDELNNIGLAVEAGTKSLPIANETLNLPAGFSGTVSYSETDTLFEVNATSTDGQVVKLAASIDIADDNMSIAFNLSGEITGADVSLKIANGSKAQLNWDLPTTREDLELDLIQAAPTGGKLSLDVEIAQVQSTEVTNPLYFNGDLTINLATVELSEIRDYYTGWAGYGRALERSYFPLPQLASLSGAFGSGSGDEINATLVVQMANASGHTVPEYNGTLVGELLPEFLTVTVSDNGNQLTIIENNAYDLVEGVSTYSENFTLGGAQGNWRYEYSAITEGDNEPFNDGFMASSTSDVGLDYPEIIYTHENCSAVFDAPAMAASSDICEVVSTWLTPIDVDSDLVTDYFELRLAESGSFNEQGRLINNEGNLVKKADLPLFTSFEPSDFNYIHQRERVLPNLPYDTSPLRVTSGVELFSGFEETNVFSFSSGVWSIKDKGDAVVKFTRDDYLALKSGSSVKLDAVVVKPIVENAVTMTVADDANQVTAEYVNGRKVTRTFAAGTGDQSSYEYNELIEFEWGQETANRLIMFTEQHPTLNAKTYTFERTSNDRYDDGSEHSFSEVYYIVPVDEFENGQIDKWEAATVYGGHVNEQGQVIDMNGNVVDFDNYFFSSVSFGEDSSRAIENTLGHYYFGRDVSQFTSALDFHKTRLQAIGDLYVYLDGEGLINVEFNPAEINTLVAGSIQTFSGIVTEPDFHTPLENEDNYLQFSALASLGFTFGDYDIDLTLSGQRAAFEAGVLDLDMSYRLGDETRRSFTLKADSNNFEVEGNEKLHLVNDSGVSVEFADFGMEGNQKVLGKMTYTVDNGTPVQVGKIVERENGAVMVIYSDDTTESL
ncbi:hypothetical protein C2869_20360 [Saccharobesus litoralis]|uniref:Uncharacterized protein n=1 Tax=Saccharobesus litoralis TaxID=2172099 RepID=A0A2S0VWK8_9ALTE|nr:hypothetical protein [Saccharobesus litoralis]AWB68606.1 hypothetical protein C2869_20360 [Saccharobesus litoralis]